VDIPQPPEQVFPWLLDEDKVPQWTSALNGYALNGSPGVGAHAVQTLDVAGGVKLDMEITGYEPPRSVEMRAVSNGVKVVSTYTLAPSGRGTRLTQALDAKPEGLSGRMVIGVVRSRLEKKVSEDLERLRGVLGG
jgi:uncharacterized protein YndB with AHSA1/START domain